MPTLMQLGAILGSIETSLTAENITYDGGAASFGAGPFRQAVDPIRSTQPRDFPLARVSHDSEPIASPKRRARDPRTMHQSGPYSGLRLWQSGEPINGKPRALNATGACWKSRYSQPHVSLVASHMT